MFDVLKKTLAARAVTLALALTAALSLLSLPHARAAGLFEGLQQDPALVGTESLPADTGLSGGRSPQSARYSFTRFGAGAVQYATPLAAGTVTVVSTTGHLVLEPAGTLATLTIVLPAAASLVDGQLLDITSTQTLTALTMTAGSGTTIVGAPTALTASATAPAGYRFVYIASSAKWYRLQ